MPAFQPIFTPKPPTTAGLRALAYIRLSSERHWGFKKNERTLSPLEIRRATLSFRAHLRGSLYLAPIPSSVELPRRTKSFVDFPTVFKFIEGSKSSRDAQQRLPRPSWCPLGCRQVLGRLVRYATVVTGRYSACCAGESPRLSQTILSVGFVAEFACFLCRFLFCRWPFRN